ncbi:MAG: putative bifunctional diguanylate cyclase/phosphodiesterase [Vicinamibacterales bacterium]
MHEIDVLTGLPNRLGLASRLDHAIAVARREGESAAVFFLDLDGFKAVNDGRGHAAGDAVLCEIAGRLRARLRDSDTVARLGGDEFVVIAERMGDGAQASTLARKLLGVVAEPVRTHGETLCVTASIGISLCPADGDTAARLIDAADAAMYAAKRDGKDGFRFYSRQMHEAAEARLALEMALQEGLERGELGLVYQPEWDVIRRRVSAAEARVVWTRPDLGIMTAANALAVADQGALSAALAHWMLATACADAARLHANGVCVPVALRLTARQIGNRAFVSDVRRELQRHSLAPTALRLEVVEGAAAPLARDVVASLQDLETLGVAVGLAEFGSGCASLSTVTAAPFRTVRLARSVVADADGSGRATALVAAAVAISRPLGLQVVADGVDDEATANRMAAAGCGIVQGEHLAPPLPVPDLIFYLRRGRSLARLVPGPGAVRPWCGRAWRAASVMGRREPSRLMSARGAA